VLRTSQENEDRGDPGELDEPQDKERERADRDLVIAADSRAEDSSGSQDMGYDTTAIVTADQSAPPPPPPKLGSTAFDTTVKQQEGLWDWDRGPSVSGSGDIIFLPGALFDISLRSCKMRKCIKKILT